MLSLSDRMRNWRFDRKMRVFVSLSIACTTTFILIASAVLFWLISVDNSRRISEYQLSMTAENLSADFSRYKDMAVALTLNHSVQKYLSCSRTENTKLYYSYASQATEMLSSTCNLNPTVYAIAVLNDRENDFIIKLRNSRYASIFKSIYKNDFSHSLPLGPGKLRLTYDNAYTGSEADTLNIYFPLYSVNIINKKLGDMCIALSNDQLFQLSHHTGGETDSDLYFISSSGTVLTSGDHRIIHGKFPYFNRITAASGDDGSFRANRDLYIFRHINGWGYYLVQKIPKNALFASSVHIFLLLMAVILLMVALGIFLSDKMVNTAYRPLDNILHTMNLIKTDKLGIRIDEKRLGEDFAQLAAGFNSMMDEIERLVLRVRQDQEEKSRIQLNALQSQIQPHFLYNTLECIHWQAMADGNREIARLGMALASYYRICLSDGRDIITLNQELQHVKNYLLIQNMRYGNIIESELSVASDLSDVRIPKISLQPLVENAISHGARLKEGIKEILEITAERNGSDVIIRILNSGNGISAQEIYRMNGLLQKTSEKPGYGIRNVHRRIQLYFGDGYGLSFSANALGGVTVCVRIPYNAVLPETEDIIHV